MALIEVKVPDIGDFKEVEIIELMVKPGDTVKAEQSLITVESDKASMEIPSSHAGVVKELRVKVGDKVAEGSLLLMLETGVVAVAAGATPTPAAVPVAASQPAAPSPASAAGPVSVVVPDIGDFDELAVIELLVKVGDTVKVEQSLITVESDKASMEIPSSHAGVVAQLLVKIGDKVSKGSALALIQPTRSVAAAVQSAPIAAASAAATPAAAPRAAALPSGAAAPAAAAPAVAAPAAATPAFPSVAAQALPASGATGALSAAVPIPTPMPMPAHEPNAAKGALAHASPAIRKLARELGVPLDEISGSGPKGRITHADVQGFVKSVMAGGLKTQAQQAKAPAAAPAGAAAGGGSFPGLLPWPVVDFAKFGPVERKDLTRIKKISGANLHRNWVMIPHITNYDDADITDLEAFRVATNKENEKSGVKITMVALLIKACVSALKKFPEFNASLDGDQLVLKHYFHIGVATDTPSGLMVPVIKDADKKGILQISQELGELATKARNGKLSPADMTGGCFSISSLGGIGGRYFTQIINAPEVAILGVCKSSMQPVWDGKEFQPRLMLPLSLSWDHRVIDGAAAARFNAYLGQILADFRRVLL